MIGPFAGAQRWLSNFWPAAVMFEGMKYYCVETAFVAAKTEDDSLRRQIAGMSAGQAKRFGRTLQLRNGWMEMRESVMLELVRKKFEHEDLRAQLIATGVEEIVELNQWHDNFWGVCICERCNGGGLNKLGHILMQVREEIR